MLSSWRLPKARAQVPSASLDPKLGALDPKAATARSSDFSRDATLGDFLSEGSSSIPEARFGPYPDSESFVRDWLFSPEFYGRLSGRQWSERAKGDAWIHFVAHGWENDHSPSPFFDVAFTKRLLRTKGVTPAKPCFELWTAERSLSPSPIFDAGFYLARNPDVRRSRLDPFLHWTMWGIFEGRSPSAFLEIRPLELAQMASADRRGALQQFHSLSEYLVRHTARSSLDPFLLGPSAPSGDVFAALLDGSCHFLRSPETLFGELGEWLPAHRQALLHLELP
jgi:hypothetical protein